MRLVRALSRAAGFTALVLCFSAVWAGTAVADSMSLSLSSTTPALGTPITVTFSTNAQPIDNDGDGPYIYVVAQPTTAGSCQPTYGDDEQVVGSQAHTLDSADQVPTGASSQTYSVAEYSQATYQVCAWLETAFDDYSNSGVTTSDVVASSHETFQTVNTNTLAVAFSTGSPRPNVPFTVSLSGNATPVDSGGDGPDLYVIAQPTSAGGCQSTYGNDEQVVGSGYCQMLWIRR